MLCFTAGRGGSRGRIQTHGSLVANAVEKLESVDHLVMKRIRICSLELRLFPLKSCEYLVSGLASEVVELDDGGAALCVMYMAGFCIY